MFEAKPLLVSMLLSYAISIIVILVILILSNRRLDAKQKDIDGCTYIVNPDVENNYTMKNLEFSKRDRNEVKKILEEYAKELRSCKDEEIQNALQSTSEILDFVFRQKHPLRSVLNGIKKICCCIFCPS